MENQYLQQVMEAKAEVERDLRPRKKLSSSAAGAPMRRGGAEPAEVPAVDVRITGFGPWRSVLVPPNAYVVHTRRGAPEPLHIGLGISFRYRPYSDTFLVVPAAMQTIVINASCICRERQGLLVQGYVQWVIDDFARAYKRLDFSDPVEPMKVVNVQLREQAEATIKDTVATMSIDDVLADKQPIIEELTRRLRTVAEGGEGGDGLGLRIVTVQIKEAVVSSARLWNDLQGPFRAERRKLARLAELDNEGVVRAREDRAERERAELAIDREAAIARRRGETEAAAFDRRVQEDARRAAVEAETATERAAQQRTVLEQEATLERLKTQLALELERLRFDARVACEERELELTARRQAIDNDISTEQLQARLLRALPELAQAMPTPAEVRNINLGGAGELADLLRDALGALRALKPDAGRDA
jgi:flotillin